MPISAPDYDLVGLSPGPTAGSTLLTIPYSGLTPAALRQSEAGKQFLDNSRWYDEYELVEPAGTYDVYLFVPEAAGRTWPEQLALVDTLYPAFQPTPLCLGLAAALLARQQGLMLPDGIIRLKEQKDRDGRLQLTIRHGRIYVESRFFDHLTEPQIHLSICRPALL